MISWFGRRGRDAHSSRSRSRTQQRIERVAIDDLEPDAAHLLSYAAYIELSQFDALSRAAAAAPDLERRQQLTAAAGRVLGVHTALVDEMRRRGVDSAVAMAGHSASAEPFFDMAAGSDWYEALAGVYLTSGLLDDFFRRLFSRLPERGAELARLFDDDSAGDLLVGLLQTGMAADPTLSSRLALWGRRLLGDTLLLARAALPPAATVQEARIEPVLTDLMADHTRRMDRLGLTA